MSESVSEERKKILRAMGADLKYTPAHLGTDGAIEFVYNLIREEPDKYWLADQFNNESNWLSHYEGTAMEIWDQTGGDLDIIVSSMGTTGTLMGLSRRFKELKPDVQMVGVEPYLGHKIQGLKNMKESYRPGLFEKHRADRIRRDLKRWESNLSIPEMDPCGGKRKYKSDMSGFTITEHA